ncbi:MAG: hypothetical protein CUN55_07565, partial [Phototrophicales bacterium]
MAGERILICDDGRENREFIIEYIMQPNQFEPLVARNGLEAMEILRQQSVDLVLLDLQMPKMGGLEVLDAMKAEEIDVPVVLMTFHGSEEIAVEVYRKGVRDYVKKPFSVEEMTEVITRALSEVRLRREKEALTERLLAANSEMNQRIRELNMLYQVGKSVTSLTKLDDLLPRILRAAVDITGSEAGSLFLVQNDTLIARAIKSPQDPQIYAVNQPQKNRFAQKALETGRPFVLSRAEIDAIVADGDRPYAVLVTPMVIGQSRIIGVLLVSNYSTESRPFRKQDAAMLSALSDYAAIAIENATNFAELSRYRLSASNITADRIDAILVSLQLTGYDINVADPTALLNALTQRIENLMKTLQAKGALIQPLLSDGLIAAFNMESTNVMQILEIVQQLKEVSDVPYRMAVHTGTIVVRGDSLRMVEMAGAALNELLHMHQHTQPN